MSLKQQIRQKVTLAYLVYLGALPAVATASTLWQYGEWYPDWKFILSFLGGTAAVGVYLAFVYSYQMVPVSVGRTLLLLLDGPLLILLSQSGSVSPYGFAVEAYLVDGTAVWLSILWLALHSPDPTPNQRRASVFIMLVAIGITWLFFLPYLQVELFGNWVQMGWLLFAIIQGVALRSFLLKETDDLRDQDNAPWFIVAMILLWIAALFGGMIAYTAQFVE